MSKSSQISIILTLTVLILHVSLSHAVIPPPMLRAMCGAFADAEEAFGNQALAAGKAVGSFVLKPIAVVGGLHAAAVGTGMKVVGGATKFVGAKLVKDGGKLEFVGAGLKGVGLGTAALGLKPVAEKVVAAGTVAEKKIETAHAAAEHFAQSVGDTSIQLEATIDGPVIGHHNKGVYMAAGLNELMSHSPLHKAGQSSQQQIDLQTLPEGQRVEQESSSIVKRAVKVDPEVARAALNLVKESKLDDCVARAICDLNCNPQGFGQDGKQVFMNMVRLQGANLLNQTESKYFSDAASKGRAFSGKCDECKTVYTKCSSKSTDLIKMASHIRLD